MRNSRPSLVVALFCSTALSMSIAPASIADGKKLIEEGIAKYRAGDYSEAAGLLGAALSTEFGNPILHYYLADSYLKQNDKENAIKENQIALALQPKGQVGDYCRKALLALGITPSEKTADKPKPVAATAPAPTQVHKT